MRPFQSHLDLICWKVLRSNEENLFFSFLNLLLVTIELNHGNQEVWTPHKVLEKL